MIQLRADIISNERLAEGLCRMTLEAPDIASRVRPGQFVHVKIGGTNAPLCRRPFSVSRCVGLDGRHEESPAERSMRGLQIVYQVVGLGTRLMSELRPGEGLDVMGPLGRGFSWSRASRTHVLVGGGMGAAPLLLLADELSQAAARGELDLLVLLGVRTRQALALEEEFGALGGQVLISTDDGSHGVRGRVTEMLEDGLAAGRIPSDCAVYACGPEPMYRDLASICRQHGIRAQVALERNILCGVGACLTCTCKVNKGAVLRRRDLGPSHIELSPTDDFGYALVCTDGPVFDIDEVALNEG